MDNRAYICREKWARLASLGKDLEQDLEWNSTGVESEERIAIRISEQGKCKEAKSSRKRPVSFSNSKEIKIKK